MRQILWGFLFLTSLMHAEDYEMDGYEMPLIEGDPSELILVCTSALSAAPFYLETGRNGIEFNPLQIFNPYGVREIVNGINALSSLCAKSGLTRSKSYQVGTLDIPNVGIGFINGINNDCQEAITHTSKMSEQAYTAVLDPSAQGVRVYGVYNATNSPIIDVIECAAGHVGIRMPPAQCLIEEWMDFFDNQGEDAKFLQFCHSGGAIHVKHALELLPKSIQLRMIVVSIGGAVLIPQNLCYESYNYVSRRDFVPHLDIAGKLKYGNQLRVVESHPDAPFLDHGFSSPTFEKIIQGHIAGHIAKYGDKK